MLGFYAQNGSTPGLSGFNVVIEGGSEVLDEKSEFSFVFLSDISDGDNGGGLLVHESTQSFFV